jgi:hypothetical protein
MFKKLIATGLILFPCFSHAGGFAANVRAVQVYNDGTISAMLCPDQNYYILLGNINTPTGSGILSLALKAWESNGTKRLYLDYGATSAPNPCTTNYNANSPLSVTLWYN